MIRYDKWWKMFCKNCKYRLCSYSGLYNCDKCHNLTFGRMCNCLTDSEESEKSCPYFVDCIKEQEE